MMLEFHTIVAHEVVLKTSSGSLRQTKAHSKASLRIPVGAPRSSNLLSQKTTIKQVLSELDLEGAAREDQ